MNKILLANDSAFQIWHSERVKDFRSYWGNLKYYSITPPKLYPCVVVFDNFLIEDSDNGLFHIKEYVYVSDFQV